MTQTEALKIAWEALAYINEGANNQGPHTGISWRCAANKSADAITAIKAALEAKDEPVGLIESLKEAKPCCGQYATCWRACTPRGKFIGQRDAQRTWVGLTDMEINQGLCRTNYAMQTSGAWRDGVEWAEAKLKEKNT